MFRADGLLNYYMSMQQKHVGNPVGAGKGKGRREGKGKVKCKGKEGNKNTRMPAYVDTCLTECAAPPTRQDPGISCEDLGDRHGVSWCSRWEGVAFVCGDERRFRVRDEVKQRVVEELKLERWGAAVASLSPPSLDSAILDCSSLTLLKDTCDSATSEQDECGQLLGRYDVLAMRAYMDFDGRWQEVSAADHQAFWVLHAAALNIGESRGATDSYDFRTVHADGSNGLDERCYHEAMGRIFLNILAACRELHIEHMVFLPFGMGAFLRYLELNDPWYSSEVEKRELRRGLAKTFIDGLQEAPANLRVHLCINIHGSQEACDNGDAFLRALKEAPSAVQRLVTVYPEADCIEVARLLASGQVYGVPASSGVALVNAANRKLIGNHWFADGARCAIDENLHRRSVSLWTWACLLNGFHTFAGSTVEVTEAFCSSNSKMPRQLHVGLQGVVEDIDNHGDALIKFESIDDKQRVLKYFFGKLWCYSQESGVMGEIHPSPMDLEQRVLEISGRVWAL